MTSRLLLTVAASLCMLAGNQQAAWAQATPELKNVRVGSQGITMLNLPELFADYNGYYKEEGLAVKITAAQGDVQLLATGLLGGNYDFIATGSDISVAASEGANIKAISSRANGPPWSVVAQSGIKTYEGLKGKTIAVSSPDSIATMPLTLILRKLGMEAGRDYKHLILGSSSVRATALVSKQADAAVLITPLEFKLAKDGFENLGAVAEKLPNFTASFTAVSAEWAKANESTVVGYLRAVRRGAAYVYDPANKEDVIARAAKPLGFEPDIMRQAYEYYFEGPLRGVLIPPQLEFDPVGIKTVVDMLKETGAMRKPLDVNAFIDDSYLKKAAMAK